MKLLAGLMLLAVLPLSAQAPQGLQLKFGTWKLNLQKSKFPPGDVTTPKRHPSL